MNNKHKIAVIGLGYVGLPLAVEFGKIYKTLGFDIDKKRIKELKSGFDKTNEVSKENLKSSINLNFSLNSKDVKNSNIFIITVPTPINENKNPNITILLEASKLVAENLKKGDIVIYESTVYPGCTEEDCVPILEKHSNLKYNIDFFCGYSPERINPGDKINTLVNIQKVTSGSTPKIAKTVDDLYKSIITAGTYLTSSIKVAEASKAIENSQRDLNISFVNELAIIFDRLNIDTTEVLDAASTKWNFLNFKPGLVGGHCISVDPYYLTYKAEKLGYSPDVILSGRQVNENMADFVANKLINKMINNSLILNQSSILLLGITYKENCPDSRNTKIPEVFNILKKQDADVSVYDPKASPEEIKNKYNIDLTTELKQYDGIILAVGHSEFGEIDFTKLKKNSNSVLFDVKSFLNKENVDARL